MSEWQPTRVGQRWNLLPLRGTVGGGLRCGMTLMEILATVVILGLVCVIGASSLARRMNGDPFRDTVAKIAVAWHRFHQLAIERAGGVLEVSGGRLRMRAHNGTHHEVVLDPETQVTWWTADGRQTCNLVQFDSSGRSADLVVRLRRDERAETFLISGLTGAMRPEGESSVVGPP